MKTQPSKPQIDKFREAARELETDDSEEAFAALVKRIAKAPAPRSQVPKKPESKAGDN